MEGEARGRGEGPGAASDAGEEEGAAGDAVTECPEAERVISGMVVSAMIDHIQSVGGDKALPRFFHEAGTTRSRQELDDIDSWYSAAEAGAMIAAAGLALDDDEIEYHIGQRPTFDAEAATDPKEIALLQALAALGSVKNWVAMYPMIGERFIGGSTAEIRELDDDRAVIIQRRGEALAGQRWICPYFLGSLDFVIRSFGCRGLVEERQCQFEGAPHCEFVAHWSAAGEQGELEHTRRQLRIATRRFETLEEVASDLVSSQELESVLARILEKARSAVGAQAYLLIVQTKKDAPWTTYSHNVDPGAEPALVEQCLAAVPDEHAGSWLVADVTSARRSYGRLAAIRGAGEGKFFPEEKRLLSAYARYAAAALDAATALDQVRYLAFHDPLTGLPNRRLFEDRVGQAIALANRQHTEGAVMFVDLDNFKKVNDSLGHEKGDELLGQVADRLRAALRQSDTVGRQGGDEFTILLSHIAHVDDAAVVAEKLVDLFLDPFELSGVVLRVTASIGYACFPLHGSDTATLLKNADAAMYAAKQAGRSTYRGYTAAMNEQAAADLVLEAELQRAFGLGEISVHYQQIVDLASRVVVGMEALARWNHPRLGLLEPETFLPLAESTGLVTELDWMVLDQACEQAARWAKVLTSPVEVAVNISHRSLLDPDMLDVVSGALSRSGLSHELLQLEVTEAQAMQDRGQAACAFEKLRSLGVKIAIDDFGTAYSMLSRVEDLAVSRIKIDRTFVARIVTSDTEVPIVSGLIAMAAAVGAQVVAEGVETQVQTDFLLRHGCGLAQGYLFGRPLPAAEAEAVLLSQDS